AGARRRRRGGRAEPGAGRGARSAPADLPATGRGGSGAAVRVPHRLDTPLRLRSDGASAPPGRGASVSVAQVLAPVTTRRVVRLRIRGRRRKRGTEGPRRPIHRRTGAHVTEDSCSQEST